MTVQAPPPTKYQIAGAIRDMVRNVDERAAQCNRRWGYNRLPHLVPIEWTERFRAQKRKWEQACFECAGSLLASDLERVRAHGNGMIRAFDKLEEIAVGLGHWDTPADKWEFELNDGTLVLLVRDRSDISRVNPDGRPCQIWSLEEIADVIQRFPILSAAKAGFPGAEMIRTKTDPASIATLEELNDDVPF